MAAVLVLVSLVRAGPTGEDERHPRAPDQPLSIEFTPWFCSACLAQKLIDAEPEELQMMSMHPEELLERLGIKRKWFVIQSPHFKILSTLRGARIKSSDSRFVRGDLQRLQKILPTFKAGAQGGYVDAHQRAHLYHVRLERIYAHFSALTANKEPFLGMGARYEVYLFEEEKHYRALAEKVMGRARNPAEWVARKHVPLDKNYYVLTTASERWKGGDRELNNTVAHHLGHMLANGHRDFVRDVWAFLEAGCAHYYERRESEKHNYFCLSAQDPPADFVRGNWRKKIRHAVYRKKEPSLGQWCETVHTAQLGGMEHALSWSIVEWLATTDPVRLSKLLDKSSDSEKKPTATQAIEDVFGVSPYVLHERWRAYVLKEYK